MRFRDTIQALRREAAGVRAFPADSRERMEELKCLAAEPAVQRIRALESIRSLRDVELRVYSQFGDDGIIQYLVERLPLVNDTFVEFGVADYRESNTRFLLVRNNWRGFVMDGSRDAVASIEAQQISWRHDLRARAAFVTRENVDELVASSGFAGRIGLLHIDLDGNDYWVWQRLSVVDADIVIVEYNAVLGATRAVSVAYDPGFRRMDAHSSGLLWGASLPAFVHLASERGYVFIGCNSAGNNAYFVKESLAHALPRPSIADGFVESRFRESRGPDGALTLLAGDARRQAIADATVVDVVTGGRVKVREL